MTKQPKKDLSTRAFDIVQQATGQAPDPHAGKNPKSVAAGKLGGAKGGKARAEKLSPERRVEIASKAAKKRWGEK